MRTLIATLIVFLSFTFTSFAQIHYVSNLTNSNADFDNLQHAINHAEEGDSIYVFPSDKSYGEISITKQVVLIAKTLFSHHNDEKAKIDKVILENILHDNSDASHTVIHGFEINYLMTISDPGNHVQNVTFSSNHLNFKPNTHSTKTWKMSGNKLKN